MNVFLELLLTLKESPGSVGGNSVNNFARFISLLLVFILVLAVTYYTTRFVAKNQKGLARSANMELLESLMLGNGKYLQLVRAGGRYLVLAVGKDSVQLIAEIDEKDYRPAQDAGAGGFGRILERIRGGAEKEDEKKN